MASYYRALRQYPGAAHHQISLNFLLRHCCYFISQIYFHIGKAFEDGGGKEPQSESSCSVGALSFFFQFPDENLVPVLTLLCGAHTAEYWDRTFSIPS